MSVSSVGLEVELFRFAAFADENKVNQLTSQFRKNPILEAHQAFWQAITEQPLLLDVVAQEASRATMRVLESFKWWGSRGWDHLLGLGDDVLTRWNRRGVELTRLFFLTPEVSYRGQLQTWYASRRMNVIRSFVTALPGFRPEQVGEIYDHFGLRIEPDGSFAHQYNLRRNAA